MFMEYHMKKSCFRIPQRYMLMPPSKWHEMTGVLGVSRKLSPVAMKTIRETSRLGDSPCECAQGRRPKSAVIWTDGISFVPYPPKVSY